MNRTLKRLIGLEEMAKKNNIIVLYISHADMPPGKQAMIHEYGFRTVIFIQQGMNDKDETRTLSHETAHYYIGTCLPSTLKSAISVLENSIDDWVALYYVPHRDYKEMMLDPHIKSDYDMAEALEVEIDDIERARRRYKAMGLDVWRSDELW